MSMERHDRASTDMGVIDAWVRSTASVLSRRAVPAHGVADGCPMGCDIDAAPAPRYRRTRGH